MPPNVPLETPIVQEERSSNYRHLGFSDLCDLLRENKADLSATYRSQFPLGKTIEPKPYLCDFRRKGGIKHYLDTGEFVPKSVKLTKILTALTRSYPEGTGSDHETAANLNLDQIMGEFLEKIGASQSLVVFSDNCTGVMSRLVNAFRVPLPAKRANIVIPSRAYKASATAVRDEVEKHGIEIRIGQERGNRLSWIDIQRDAAASRSQNIDDKTYLLIIQTGSNLYGTQATLGSFNAQNGSRLEGIVENIMQINQDRGQRGIQPLAVILDDAASRAVMAWRKPDGTYTQLRVDDLPFPAAICYSAQKAYGDKGGGVGVMNKDFVTLTTFKPKKGFEGDAKWRQLLDEGGATRESLIASLNYGTRLIEEIGIERIMSHCIRGVYSLVDLLLPLVDKRKIEIISPRLREPGKVYSADQISEIHGIDDPYTRQLLSKSRIDPNRLSFNTVTLRLPGKSPHQVLQVVRYLEKNGIRVGYLNLKNALPYSEAHRPEAKPESVIRLTTSIFNNKNDYEAVASCLTNALRRR